MDKSRRERLRDEITQAREARGWSAAELSRQSGVSQTTLTKIGRLEQVAPETIKRLRDVLGLQSEVRVYDPENYDFRTQVTLEMIGQWLQAIEDPEEREEAGRYIVRCMVAHTRGNGQ